MKIITKWEVITQGGGSRLVLADKVKQSFGAVRFYLNGRLVAYVKRPRAYMIHRQSLL